MRRNILRYSLCTLLLLALCGCGREKVAYESDAEQTGAESEVETSSESDSKGESDLDEESEEGTFYTEGIAAALGAEGTIQETIETVDGDRLNIYGDVIVPDVKTMNVYRATKQEIDAEFIKQLVEAFSDDGKLYSGADEQLPKSALRGPLINAESVREEIEEAYAQGFVDDEIYRSDVVRYEDRISYYRDLYEAAGETYVPLDYDAWTGDEKVVMFHDGTAYYLEIYNNSVNCYAVDYMDVFDDLPEDVEYVEYGGQAFNRKSITDTDEQEFLRQAASDFTKRLGIGTFEITDFQDVDSLYFSQYHTEADTDEKQCGYYVHLSRKLDGVRVDASRYLYVPLFDSEQQSMQDQEQWYEQHDLADKSLEALDLMLDDDFQVIGFHYEGPMSVPEVATANATLLPYESAKASLLASLEKEPVYDGSRSTSDEDGNVSYEVKKNYSDLELLYFRMENPDKEGEYLIVPAWRLAISDLDEYGDNACLINALDGSRIDLQDELVEWVERSE